MPNFIIFEDSTTLDLLPLTYTRPIFELRIGIDLIREKWESWLQTDVGTICFSYLRHKYNKFVNDEDVIFINGKIIPDKNCIEHLINSLNPRQGFLGVKGEILAFRYNSSFLLESDETSYFDVNHLPMDISFFDYSNYESLRMVERLPDIFLLNGSQIRDDFKRLTEFRRSEDSNDRYTIVYNPQNIFIEEGVKIRAAILNAEDGPIYIGRNAQIMESAVIHGTHAICEGSVIQMGTKLKGDSTIGPYCKVGGEISNSVFMGYSNKSHDGFVGNSIIGEWCNLGANTNVSNLKNSYSNVKIFNHSKERLIDTGLQFCGLIMGDYSKTGINTMFNTGTTVDVSANVFGTGFPAKHIPSFSWSSVDETDVFDFEKALTTIEKMMARRNKELSIEDRLILLSVFEQTVKYRVGQY